MRLSSLLDDIRYNEAEFGSRPSAVYLSLDDITDVLTELAGDASVQAAYVSSDEEKKAMNLSPAPEGVAFWIAGIPVCRASDVRSGSPRFVR